jgi:hypothetical protein
MSFYEDWNFIALIPKGAKPCFYDKTLVHVNEWFVTFKRRLKGEKGEKGIVYVENLLETTEKTICISDVNSLRNLKDILQKSIIGLTNLVYTYKIDGQLEVSKNYSCMIEKVEKIIEDIDRQIRNKTNFFSYIPKIIQN